MAAASSVRRTACARATKSAAIVGKTAKAKAKAKSKSKSASAKTTATKRTKADATRKAVIEVEAVAASDALTPSPTATKTACALGRTMAEGGSLSADETSPRDAAGSAKRSRSAPTKKSLVQRVYNTIDGELTKLEKQKGLTSQDRERASRALSQMVNALEKAVEMQREMTKTKTSGGGAKSRESLAHAEDLRREIAERLERLNRKRAAPRSSE